MGAGSCSIGTDDDDVYDEAELDDDNSDERVAEDDDEGDEVGVLSSLRLRSSSYELGYDELPSRMGIPRPACRKASWMYSSWI